MRAGVQEFGHERNRLVVADDFLPEPMRYVDMAAALAPFAPEVVTGYPGLRAQLSPGQPAEHYVQAVLKRAGPLIAKAFDAAAYQIVEASFAIVTKRPAELGPLQKLPHRDSNDANYLALLHHLHHVPGTSTNFFRHRRTGFERVTEERHAAFNAAAEQDTAEYGAPGGDGLADTDRRFEKIHEAPAAFNRLLIYRGSLLHSGYVPEDFAYDPSPRTGRLTGMVFLVTTPRTA